MPRKPRVLTPTGTYHVVIRGSDHQLMFEEQKDYLQYLDILSFYKEQCSFEIYAYCLMPNHVHLIIHSATTPLSSIFRRINTKFSTWFNHKYQRTGYLQQGRYYSEPIEDDEYLLTAIRYVHHNPQKAGLEETLGTVYPWSSYRNYLDSDDDLVDTHFPLSVYGSIDNFLYHHVLPSEDNVLDTELFRSRIPDSIAKEILFAETKCANASDFQSLRQAERDRYISILYKKGLSIRQINRLCGVPKGIIEKAIKTSTADSSHSECLQDKRNVPKAEGKGTLL